VTGAASPLARWRTPLAVLVAGSLIGFVAFGIRSSSGLFLAPISGDLKWGREIFALSVAIQNIVWGIGVPIAGAIADKFGSGRVLAVGALVYAAGLALMAYSTTPLQMHLTAGLLLGMGLAGTSFTIAIAAISRVVAPERRTRAVGIAMAATSLGQFVLLPLGQYFIQTQGWAIAALLLAGVALVMFPLAAAVTGKGAPSPGMADQTLRAAFGEALGHPSYVLLTTAFFVCGFQLLFIVNHLPAYLADNGLPSWVASWTLALVGLTNVLGNVLAGWVGQKWRKKYGLSLIYGFRAAFIAAFILIPPTPATTLIFGGMMGLLWLSTVPLTSGLVAQFFGLRWLATLFGFAFFGHQIGGFLGVWLGGVLFEAYQSYMPMWWINVALGVAAAFMHLPIREAPVARLAGQRA
jgi:predicted MFS family arabinose efflux permease